MMSLKQPVMSVICLFGALYAGASGAVTVIEDSVSIQVNTGVISATVSKDPAYCITEVRDPASGHTFAGNLFVSYVSPKPADGAVFQPAESAPIGSVTTSVIGAGTSQVTIVRVFSFSMASCEERTVFRDNSRVFDRRLIITTSAQIDEIGFASRVSGEVCDRAVFLPENERIENYPKGLRVMPTVSGLPFVELFDPQTNCGLGMKASGSTTRVGRQVFGLPEGGDYLPAREASMTLISQVLSQQAPGTFVLECSGYMEVGGNLPFSPQLPPIEIRKLLAKKLLSRPGETNDEELVLRNNTGYSKTVDIAIDLIRGLDETVPLIGFQTLLAPNETKSFLVPVDTTMFNYGAEVKCRATDVSTGTTVMASDYINVHESGYRVSQMENMHTNQDGGYWQWQNPWVRRSHVALMEAYAFAPLQMTDLTPSAERYYPITEAGMWGGIEGPVITSNLKGWVSRLHDQGMRAMAETTPAMTVDAYMDNPEYVRYRANGQAVYGHFIVHPDAAYETGGLVPDYLESATIATLLVDSAPLHIWAGEMAASTSMFGWDGVRLDAMPANFLNLWASYDPLHVYDGEEILYDFWGLDVQRDGDIDGWARSNVDYWIDTVRAVNPKFEMGFNTAFNGSGPLYVTYYPQSYAYMGSENSWMLYEEAASLRNSERYNTWEKWATELSANYRAAPAVGGICAVGVLGWEPYYTERTRLYLSFAAGHHIYAAAYGWKDSAIGAAKYECYEHAWRFSEFFFDGSYEALPDTQTTVSVQGDSRLCWRHFVRRKDLSDSAEEWLVHIVNRPDDETVVKNYGPLPVRSSATAIFNLPAGTSVLECKVLLPDPPRAEDRPYQVQGNSIVVAVGDVESIATVVLRVAKWQSAPGEDIVVSTSDGAMRILNGDSLTQTAYDMYGSTTCILPLGDGNLLTARSDGSVDIRSSADLSCIVRDDWGSVVGRYCTKAMELTNGNVLITANDGLTDVRKMIDLSGVARQNIGYPVVQLAMQPDGDIVAFRQDYGPQWGFIWNGNDFDSSTTPPQFRLIATWDPGYPATAMGIQSDGDIVAGRNVQDYSNLFILDGLSLVPAKSLDNWGLVPNHIIVLPNDNIVVARSDGLVDIRDKDDLGLLLGRHNFGVPVNAMALLPNGNLAVALSDGTISISYGTDMNPVRGAVGFGNITHLAVQSDGDLVVGSAEGNVWLLDGATLATKAGLSGLGMITHLVVEKATTAIPDIVTISHVKTVADGATVKSSGVVTAVFADFFYIESQDRMSGVRVVKTGHGVAIGQLVDVIGTVGTLASGERYISALSLDVTAAL